MLYKVCKINEKLILLTFVSKKILGWCDSRRVAQESYKRRIKPPEHLRFFFLNQASIIPSSVTIFIKTNKNQWQFIKKNFFEKMLGK